MLRNFIEKLITVANPQRYKYKEEKDYIQSILTEYKNKRPVYEEFRLAMHKALEAMLKDGEYKYQLLSRTKSPERLEEKLVRKGKEGVLYHSAEEIKDLVGLRIIFYTERDKEKFLKDIKNQIGGFMKIEEMERDGGYKSTHIIMSFGPKRLELSEYRHFRGLRGEVQLTSVLHHAWADIEHDLIYKDINNLKNKDPEKFELMKKKMNILLEKYIEKAAKELDKIIEEVKDES